MRTSRDGGKLVRTRSAMGQKILSSRKLRGASALVALALSAPYPVAVERNVEARMRDGGVLRSDVYRPEAPGRFPTLLKRTPDPQGASSEIPFSRRLASQGFVVAVQDTRGRYTSDGVSRPHEEAEDGRDTVEGLAARRPARGRAGGVGGRGGA